MPNYQIQYDERGRPFTDFTGARSYISPQSMGQGTPTNRGKVGWNTETGEWVSNEKSRWELAMDWAIAAGLTGGVASAFMPEAGAAASVTAGSEFALPGELGVGGAMVPAADAIAPAAASSVAPTVAQTGQIAGGPSATPSWSSLLRYGAPAAEGAINSYLSSKNDRENSQRSTALAESNLDPYRGFMHQASDVGRLDRLATADYGASDTTVPGRYGGTVKAAPGWTPSQMVRDVAGQARDRVARGERVPSMTDPNNYGAMPSVNYAGPAGPVATAAAAPSGPTGPSMAETSAASKPGGASRVERMAHPDDPQDPNPWLEHDWLSPLEALRNPEPLPQHYSMPSAGPTPSTPGTFGREPQPQSSPGWRDLLNRIRRMAR